MKKNKVSEITLENARKVVKVINAGLVGGTEGEPIPGKLCVESAVAFALGYPHNDQPKCVAQCVASFKIVLNDADLWKSNKDRAKGLRNIAVAQLGSSSIVRSDKFRRKVLMELKERLLPELGDMINTPGINWRSLLQEAADDKKFTRILTYHLDEDEGVVIGLVKSILLDRDLESMVEQLETVGDRDVTDKFIVCAIEALRTLNVPGVGLMDQLIDEGVLSSYDFDHAY